MGRRAPIRAGAALLLAAILAACQAAPSGSEPPIPSSGPATPVASSPATLGPSMPAAPPSEAPAATGAPWTQGQALLLSGVQPAIRSTCIPALELPTDAGDGLNCRGTDAVATVDFFLYADASAMRDDYFARLAAHDVGPDSGVMCRDGAPGEGADTPGIEGTEHRLGCFIDDDGIAWVIVSVPFAGGSQGVTIEVAGAEGATIEDVILALFGPPQARIGCTYCVGDLWSPGRPD